MKWPHACQIIDLRENAGVKITGRRGRWAVYLQDPNGYTIELYCD